MLLCWQWWKQFPRTQRETQETQEAQTQSVGAEFVALITLFMASLFFYVHVMPFCSSFMLQHQSPSFFFFFFFSLSSVWNNMDRLSPRQRMDVCYELDTRLIQDWRLIRGLCLNFAWWRYVRRMTTHSSLLHCSTVVDPVARGTTSSKPFGFATHCFVLLWKWAIKDRPSFSFGQTIFFVLMQCIRTGYVTWFRCCWLA